jgi:integrase
MYFLKKDRRYAAVTNEGQYIRKEDLHRQLAALLAMYDDVVSPNNVSRSGSRRLSEQTAYKRRTEMHRAITELQSVLRFRLERLDTIKRRHIFALYNYWKDNGIAESTIRIRLSHLRTLCFWLTIEKVMPRTSEILGGNSAPRAAQSDRSWSGANVDPVSKINDVYHCDANVGLVLELMLAFGMRLEEACLFSPPEEIGRTIRIVRGAKGGRKRAVWVDTPAQRRVLRRARARLDGDNAIPDGSNLAQFKRRIYYILEKCGITKKDLGITSHGLRHQFAQSLYGKNAGAEAPIKGGSQTPDPRRRQRARALVAKQLGHNRPEITDAYIGAQPRRQKKKSRTARRVEGRSSQK